MPGYGIAAARNLRGAIRTAGQEPAGPAHPMAGSAARPC